MFLLAHQQKPQNVAISLAGFSLSNLVFGRLEERLSIRKRLKSKAISSASKRSKRRSKKFYKKKSSRLNILMTSKDENLFLESHKFKSAAFRASSLIGQSGNFSNFSAPISNLFDFFQFLSL